MADEKILSYNDVVLRRSDLDILSSPEFLNDRIIEFYFSFLSSCFPSQDVLLVPPSICFWIANCPDLNSLKDFIEPLKFPDKKVVIFAVNDNNDVTIAEGGTHWSLLAYERNANLFVHHDSFAGSNRWHAQNLYRVLVDFIGHSDASSTAQLIEYSNTPQQINGYDCGLYVTAIAKVICHWHESGRSKHEGELWFSSLRDQVGPSSVSEMRNEILMLIMDLMAKK